jgi:hypothetical protein
MEEFKVHREDAAVVERPVHGALAPIAQLSIERDPGFRQRGPEDQRLARPALELLASGLRGPGHRAREGALRFGAEGLPYGIAHAGPPQKAGFRRSMC